MRAANGITGWYEAFYKAPYCHQYLDVGNRNPYHWMIHEATHQLNHEVAQLKLRRWINEGLACYFGVSTLKAHGINAGTVDPAAYPIWWYPRIRLSGDKARDIRKKRFIPLKNILMDNNNPDIDKHFNLYYIHWHSLVHYLINYQNGKHLKGFYKVLENGGSMRSFHEQIGELNVIEDQWYNHLIELKKEVKDLQKKRDSQRREDFKKLGKEQYNKENVGNPTPK
jgi:hypothetical protein